MQNAFNIICGDDMAEVAVYFHSAVDSTIQKNFDGMCRNSIYIVKILGSKGPMNMGMLAECMHTSKEQVSRSIKSLVEQGLVHREKNQENMRQVIVQLTPEGQAFLKKSNESITEEMARLIDKLSEDQQSQMVESLHTLADLIKAMNKAHSDAEADK